MVVDLSVLWAGPLATSLLAAIGAEVIKVDPEARPDGLRHHDEVYRYLNGNKSVVDLDLRQDADRRQFEALLERADLLVDSFSRRVMPNFGYRPADLLVRFPRLSWISIVAFPLGSAEQHWVSYGPGVHAISGLADRGTGPFQPAPIAYPDAVAGLLAFAVAAEMLWTGTSSGRAEISLAGALAPLIDRAVADRDRTEGETR